MELVELHKLIELQKLTAGLILSSEQHGVEQRAADQFDNMSSFR